MSNIGQSNGDVRCASGPLVEVHAKQSELPLVWIQEPIALASFTSSTTSPHNIVIELQYPRFHQSSTMATIKGLGVAQKHDGSALRIGIVHARWNACKLPLHPSHREVSLPNVHARHGADRQR